MTDPYIDIGLRRFDPFIIRTYPTSLDADGINEPYEPGPGESKAPIDDRLDECALCQIGRCQPHEIHHPTFRGRWIVHGVGLVH